ncbi:uncharacterized protein [Choristoneura fumiferana]|uniref:uncharacterized protein n=1 Tax=Choristoneura fumiferana TaxID=7141 RepID=UPI003D155742
MGKRSKTSSKVLDLQFLAANEGTDEQDVTNLNKSEIIESNNTVKTKKKKRKHANADADNDTSAQAAFVDVGIHAVDDELDKSTTLESKKKKKKKLQSTHDEELPIEETGIKNVTNEIKDDESNIPKKKKKKNKDNSVVDENKTEIDQMNKETVENEAKISKKKKKIHNSLNGDSLAPETSTQNVSVDEKLKLSKSQKKKKTGTPVLNAEESQVTEEDIDRFCDELDEEDNKQYEDWVKLIEASLPPPRGKK